MARVNAARGGAGQATGVAGLDIPRPMGKSAAQMQPGGEKSRMSGPFARDAGRFGQAQGRMGEETSE